MSVFGKKVGGPAAGSSPGFAQARTSISPTGNTAATEVSASAAPAAPVPFDLGHVQSEIKHYVDMKLETPDFRRAHKQLLSEVADKLDVAALERLAPEVKRRRVLDYLDSIIPTLTYPLTAAQIKAIREQVVDELLGFGPIEPLLQDPDVTDILINTANQVYIETRGKLHLTDVTFSDEQHLLGIIQRIVSRVGRRVDESTPMVDARMPDGSRFNAIIPPLALDGCLVSIRRFKKNKMGLEHYPQMGSMSEIMARFLAVASNVRLNMIISGGTGSGKTTLLNALSGQIDPGERIITIEDAAELMLMQPHVLRLETRPASIEGKGEITQRSLVKNALRMRPDRIILGEMRGDEVIDVLAAMNTGHDGSMATIHANNPRDALARIENLVAMSSVNVPPQSVRAQIASAVNIIIQVSRMRDGTRRVTNIDEITGVDGGNILMQPLFGFRNAGVDEHGRIKGEYVCHTMRPYCLARAELYGLDKEMLECFRPAL